MSPRLLLNLVYVHLRQQCDHAEKCTEKGCASGCGFRRLDGWLASPLTQWDAEHDERVRQRRAALWRGEIPA